MSNVEFSRADRSHEARPRAARGRAPARRRRGTSAGARNFAPPPLAPSAEEIDLDSDPSGLQTGAITHFQKENERLFFRTVPEVAQLFRAMLATVQRRIEHIRGRPCRPSDALEAMLDHALATWRPKKRTRRDYKVFERDGWRCTAPGCTSYRNLHRHHIVRGGAELL